MPKAKPFTRSQILTAMVKTKSVRAAARYLGCSYHHLKAWMKNYESTEEGYKNLFEQHKNQSGKGVPKFLKGYKDFNILDVCEGRVSHSHFTPQKIKTKLIFEGHLAEKCIRCGMDEKRVIDYKTPLIFHFKDGNKNNYNLANIGLLCYNCYFLYVGEIFDDKQIEGLEDNRQVSNSQIDWDMDEYTKKRLKELGLNLENDEDDLGDMMESFISKL
jgi:transposase